MLGIDPMAQRDRMMQALEIILRLFRGETVTARTDWFTLANARVHLLPYTRPYPEVAVASAVTPSGRRAAGRLGLGMLCLAASMPDGFDALDTNWRVAQEIAAENGRRMDPSVLRLVGQMHIAESREQARANARFGFLKWLDYFNKIIPTRYADLAGSRPAASCAGRLMMRSPRRLARLDLREHRGFQRAARPGGRGNVRQARSRARGKEPRGGLEGSDGEVARLGRTCGLCRLGIQ